MKKIIARVAVVLLAASALGACTGTINNARSVSGPGVHYIDARQRAVLINPLVTPKPKGGTAASADANAARPAFRSCSEPQPDVFTTLAVSLGLDLGLAPSSGTDSVKVATALSENASTISRTQTINLLRESFFRTCERFLNDSQMSPEMLVQAARDQRMMVSVLAIEQLTGAITPPPVTIISSSNAAVTGDAAKMMERLDAAKADFTTADTAATKAETESKALETSNTCPDIRKVAEATRTQEQKDKLAACDAAKAKATTARAAAESAKGHYEALKSVAAAGAGGTSANTGGSVTGGGNPANPPSAADRAAVAQVVERIVKNTFDIDEYTMLCVRMLSNRVDDGVLDGACMEAISDGVRNEQAARLARAIESRRLISESQIGVVLSFVAPDGKFSTARRDELVQRLEASQRGRATYFAQAADIASVRSAWTLTDDPTRSLLAEAATSPPPTP